MICLVMQVIFLARKSFKKNREAGTVFAHSNTYCFCLFFTSKLAYMGHHFYHPLLSLSPFLCIPSDSTPGLLRILARKERVVFLCPAVWNCYKFLGSKHNCLKRFPFSAHFSPLMYFPRDDPTERKYTQKIHATLWNSWLTSGNLIAEALVFASSHLSCRGVPLLPSGSCSCHPFSAHVFFLPNHRHYGASTYGPCHVGNCGI